LIDASHLVNIATALDLNTREEALLVWIALFFGWMIAIKRDVRRPILRLLMVAFSWVLLRMYLLAATYAAIGIFILHRLGFWDWNLLKISILWFFGSGGLAGLLSTNGKCRSLRDTLVGTITFTAVLEFFVTLYTLPFIYEFVTLPIVFLVAGVQVVAQKLPQFRGARYDPPRLYSGRLRARFGMLPTNSELLLLRSEFDG
jgi:uncharacterized membrane protein